MADKKNSLTMPLIITCYFFLSLLYTIRGELNFFGNKMQFSHHFMQFVVSITHFTVAYAYVSDYNYDEKAYPHILENPQFIKVVLVYLVIVGLLTAFYMMFKR